MKRKYGMMPKRGCWPMLVKTRSVSRSAGVDCKRSAETRNDADSLRRRLQPRAEVDLLAATLAD